MYIKKGRPSQKESSNHNFKHGGKGTRLYNIWKGLKSRCFNVNNISYKYYGLKGISICDEWSSFVNFKTWSLNNGYNDLLTIDRIDSNMNYSQDNCRWVDSVVQNNNTCRNRYHYIDGKKLTTAQVSKEYNINITTLNSRINKLNWPIEKAITYGRCN